MLRVAILGGGLSGLAAGYFLAAKGVDFVVFEAQDDVGGLERTVVREGFTFDVGGGHILYSRDRKVLDLIIDLVGPGNLRRNVRNTKIYYKGRYIKYPFENGLGDLPDGDKVRCLCGYIEAHCARTSGDPEPENFRDWILWRFGEGIAECFMFPYNEKLWNVDLSTMAVDWVRGRVPDAPLEDVVKAALGIPTEGYTHQLRFYYPLRGGYQTIPNAFAAKIRSRIRVGTRVECVERSRSGWLVNGDRFDRVLSTIPLDVLTDVLMPVRDDVKAAARRLRYCGLVTVLIGLDEPVSEPYSWVYLPHAETGICNRVTYFSNYSPYNAPSGKGSILAEVTYLRGSRFAMNQSVVDDVVSSLHEIGIIDRSKVCHTSWWVNDPAYLVYTHGYDADLATIFDYVEDLGINTIGRFGRFRYQNSDHVVRDVMEFIGNEF